MSLPLLCTAGDIVRQLLIDLTLAVDATGQYSPGTPPLYTGSPWPAFADNEPASPDNCLTAYATAPQHDGRSMVDGEVWRHWGFQVRLRSTTQPVGAVKVAAVENTLNESVYRRTVTVDGVPYWLHCLTSTLVMDYRGTQAPSDKRWLWFMNGKAALRRLS